MRELPVIYLAELYIFCQLWAGDFYPENCPNTAAGHRHPLSRGETLEFCIQGATGQRWRLDRNPAVERELTQKHDWLEIFQIFQTVTEAVSMGGRGGYQAWKTISAMIRRPQWKAKYVELIRTTLELQPKHLMLQQIFLSIDKVSDLAQSSNFVINLQSDLVTGVIPTSLL